MKIQRIIKYVLSRNGVLGNLFAGTRVANVVRTSDDRVNFNYATSSSPGVYGSTTSAVYDNTKTFIVTVGGATGVGVTISLTGLTYSFRINTEFAGRRSLYLPDDSYTYLATSATGATAGGTVNVPPSGGTTSISI